MSDFVKQFINDKYKQIDIWKESDKSKIVLAYDESDRQVYVIKYLKHLLIHHNFNMNCKVPS